MNFKIIIKHNVHIKIINLLFFPNKKKKHLKSSQLLNYKGAVIQMNGLIENSYIELVLLLFGGLIIFNAFQYLFSRLDNLKQEDTSWENKALTRLKN